MRVDPEMVKGQLRERGLRVTEPRVAVLGYLASTDRHPTAEEVETAVNADGPVISRASVYNVLHSLSRVGLVAGMSVKDGPARYDAHVAPHHHLVCRSCGRVEDVAWGDFGVAEEGILPDGRAVRTLSLTLDGLCTGCR
ncbi:MAG: transcriptional repressor [Thermoanaerobaculia bacterium]|nr:transcriptional repressor [Thermoanaerobaculia bacterium]